MWEKIELSKKCISHNPYDTQKSRLYIKNVHVIKTMSRESDVPLENVARLSCVIME